MDGLRPSRPIDNENRERPDASGRERRPGYARHVRAVIAIMVTLAASSAAAEPGEHGSAGFELRLHRGDTEQDEVAHYGYYPSIVVDGSARVGGGIEVAAAVAAARVSAVWENIGGVANGMLSARMRLARPAWIAELEAGVAFPLDRSIPAPDCFPEQEDGDSLVLAYGEETACWDRSAYRRAALHRGAWDIWLWAPDWVTVAATARLETSAPTYLYYAVDVGAGGAVAVTDAHDGAALIGQIAPEIGAQLAARWRAGLRGIAAGVMLDDTSPILISLEPFVAYQRDVVRIRLGLLLPLADLRNEEVPPGQGGYEITEHKSLGLGVTAFF